MTHRSRTDFLLRGASIPSAAQIRKKYLCSTFAVKIGTDICEEIFYLSYKSVGFSPERYDAAKRVSCSEYEYNAQLEFDWNTDSQLLHPLSRDGHQRGQIHTIIFSNIVEEHITDPKLSRTSMHYETRIQLAQGHFSSIMPVTTNFSVVEY